jgi:hypothetical protein
MPRAALELDLVMCRETSKYFVCHNGTEKTVTYVDQCAGRAERG